MRMKWIVLAAVAVFALPGLALAHDTDSKSRNASKLCKALKAEMGVDAFRAAYGSNHNKRHAHGKCVSQYRHVMKRLVADAVAQCKTELGITGKSLRHGRPSGDTEQGNDDKRAKRAAFRACVKEKVRAALAELKAKFAAAVEQCKTEQAADPAAFDVKYGKGEKHRRAFARCVFQHVSESQSQTA
jgi:hypothetical protein